MNGLHRSLKSTEQKKKKTYYQCFLVKSIRTSIAAIALARTVGGIDVVKIKPEP
jgi:hypothetical protein